MPAMRIADFSAMLSLFHSVLRRVVKTGSIAALL